MVKIEKFCLIFRLYYLLTIDHCCSEQELKTKSSSLTGDENSEEILRYIKNPEIKKKGKPSCKIPPKFLPIYVNHQLSLYTLLCNQLDLSLITIFFKTVFSF